MINQEQENQATISKYDPAMINRLKKEIIQDLEARRDWQEEAYEYPPAYGNRRGRRAYGPPPMPPMRGRNYPELDYDWWADREEYEYQRNQAVLKNELRRELMALDQMNRRVGQINDPVVRQALVELLQEARQQGAGIPDLLQSLNTNSQGNMGNMGSVLDRVVGPLRGIDRRSFGWGIGAALLGFMLMPSLTKSLRCLTEKTMGGSMGFPEGSQNIFERAREEFDSIVAEAQGNGPGKGNQPKK